MVQEAHGTGTTILMVSHNRSQAERLAEEVIFVDQGRIAEAAPVATFFAGPTHEAAQKFLAHY